VNSSKPLSGKSILVVEDQPLIALNVTEVLQIAGAATITAGCTIDACTHLDENDIAAAVVDIDLGLSGDCETLCHALQRNGIPFIFYTGHTNAPLMRLWPFVPILGKPASDRELLNMVERIVAPLTPNPASAQSAQLSHTRRAG
jgi:DNA-binding NtrC family response regulator